MVALRKCAVRERVGRRREGYRVVAWARNTWMQSPVPRMRRSVGEASAKGMRYRFVSDGSLSSSSSDLAAPFDGRTILRRRSWTGRGETQNLRKFFQVRVKKSRGFFELDLVWERFELFLGFK